MDYISVIKFVMDLVKFLLRPLIWIYNQLPIEIKLKKAKLRLGVIDSPRRSHYWEYITSKNKKKITVQTYWVISNSLPYNLTTLNVNLLKPQKAKGSWYVKSTKSDYWGHYDIPQGYTAELEATFIIDGKYVLNKNSIVKAEIEIVDPLNKIHKLPIIEVKSHPRLNMSRQPHLKTENISLLKNEIEKQIASILKNEVEQYKVRGRREGKLGTVDWQNSNLEWRTEGAKIKFLSDESLKTNVSSEHINAIVKLFKKSSIVDQKIIIKSLLKRIDKNIEYCNVAYLIAFALFELGMLDKIFNTALKKLQGDSVNGFSDMLRMIDILLALRHDEFDKSLIDKIEKFVYSINEHTFKIKERINAIRVKTILSESGKLSPAIVE